MDVIINAQLDTVPEGAKEQLTQGTALLNLLVCLGYDSANPPLAELLSQYHCLEGQWLIVSPVHWQATHNNAVITASGSLLAMNEDESKEQFYRLSEYLKQEGLALYLHDQYTWLLSTNHKSLLNAKPVHLVLNKPLMLELASIDKTMHWTKFLTEIQMFFASSARHSLINGVWLWSSASLGEKRNIKICADKTFYPLAQLCSTNVSLYQATSSLSEFDVLLVDNWSLLSTSHQKQLEKIAVHWHWNNVGYEVSQVHWFTRLWRKLINAH